MIYFKVGLCLKIKNDFNMVLLAVIRSGAGGIL